MLAVPWIAIVLSTAPLFYVPGTLSYPNRWKIRKNMPASLPFLNFQKPVIRGRIRFFHWAGFVDTGYSTLHCPGGPSVPPGCKCAELEFGEGVNSSSASLRPYLRVV